MEKKTSLSRLGTVLFCVVFVGCAGMQRSCSSCGAQSFGADWVIVQMDVEGRPFRCWELHNVSIANEEHSAGIYWTGSNGHLVHISNLYNRVQVVGGDWAGAYREVGLTRETCTAIRSRTFDPASGTYSAPAPASSR